MRHVKLAKAPLRFTAQAYPGDDLVRFLEPVLALALIDQSAFPNFSPWQIDTQKACVTISRFDATASRIVVDLISGLVSFWFLRPTGKKRRLVVTRVLHDTAPVVLSKACQYKPYWYLFRGLNDLWQLLCGALRAAHCASPRIVAIYGRREGDRNLSLLDTDIWQRKPLWVDSAVYTMRTERNEPHRREPAPLERCGSVVVTYLGQRQRSVKTESVEREIICYRRLLPMMRAEPDRDPPIASRRRDDILRRMRVEVPGLRPPEFERAWIAATMAVRVERLDAQQQHSDRGDRGRQFTGPPRDHTRAK